MLELSQSIFGLLILLAKAENERLKEDGQRDGKAC